MPGAHGRADRRGGAGRAGQDGASAVEFALVLVPLVTLLFGLIQYGFYFYATQTAAAVAGEAVRRVAVGDCPTEAGLKQFVADRVRAASVGNLTVSRTYSPSPATVGGTVTVDVRFDSLDLNFPFVPVPADGRVGRRVDARVEDTNPSGDCS